ncbi:AraC family transcriptional regulator [Lacibacter sp. H375]|uniref:helix-turn-helix domain-containing protein n=1 Tax=Lacibacter sp. H375 TaxID=3133424 RepID=UPI0030BEC6E5
MKKTTIFIISREERKVLASLKSRMRKMPWLDYGIQKLVIETGINRTKLQQSFYFLFGVPIHVYLLEQRMTFAKKLLRQTTLPVKAVATQSGFKSEKYFFRFFKQKTSSTPIAYRKRSKNPKP